MKTYLALFIAALFTSTLLTPLLRRLCERTRWLNRPAEHRHDEEPHQIPRLGGVAIFASMLITLSLPFLPLVNNLLTQSVRAQSRLLLIILLPATLVFLLGIYDDLRDAKPIFKLCVEVAAAIIFYLLGGRVEALSVPFVGSVMLDPWVGFVLTIIWVVGITNAFNLIDGVDGLAAGAALFSSLVIMVVSIMSGHTLVTVAAIALCGVLLGFLRYNFNPASIFMGDSGSLFVGFTLAALSVSGSQKASTAIAVAIPIMTFAVPMMDAAFTIVRRFLSGQHVLKGDREHFHHMLLARGWSERRVAIVLYGVCALFGLMALLFVNDSGGRMTGLVLFVVGTAVWFAIGRLRYHEVEEVRASMRRNLAERRLRGVNNLRVRRACQALSKATTIVEVFAAIERMLEHGEFAYATAQVGHASSAERNAAVLAAEKLDEGLSGTISLRDQMIGWSWYGDAAAAREVKGSNDFWTLRLPLSTANAEWGYINFYREFGRTTPLLLDINYMCNHFQREMARAVERVLCANESREGQAAEMALSLSGTK